MASTFPKLLGTVMLYPNFMTSNQPFSAKGILKFAQLNQASEYSREATELIPHLTQKIE